MGRRHRMVLIGGSLFFLLADWGVSIAEAQMFGSRSMGRPFQSRRSTPQLPTDASEAAGTLQGNERFLRENRSRGAFVGADRSSLQGFVGSSQAIGVGRVRAATESLTPPPDPSGRLNRPLPRQPAQGMYYPRLELDDSLVMDSGQGLSMSSARVELDKQLASRLSRVSGFPIEVRREGDTVILEGTVASQAQAEKLAIMASFEPRVSNVENRLSSE